MMIHTDTIKATLMYEINRTEEMIDALSEISGAEGRYQQGKLAGLRRAYKNLIGDWPEETRK